MIDFRLTDEMNPRNAARVTGYLDEPRLWIPTEEDYGTRHGEWLEKIEHRLINKEAMALLATLGLEAAGVIIFRPEDSETSSIRNISINPNYEGRRIGSFMLRNAEHAAQEAHPGTKRIIVDTKITNSAMISFLESQGYAPEEIVDLYDSGKLDVVLSKTL